LKPHGGADLTILLSVSRNLKRRIETIYIGIPRPVFVV